MSEVASLRDLVELRGEKISVAKDPRLPYIGLEHVAQNSGAIIGSAPSTSSVSINNTFVAGDILFGKLRPNLRKCAQATFAGYCSTDLLVFRAKAPTNPGFAARTLQSDRVFAEALRTAEGTKMPRTSWPALQHLEVFNPPVSQQRRIAEILDAVDHSIRSIERLIVKLEQVKRGLLHDLLESRFEVADVFCTLRDVATVTVGFVGPTAEHYTSAGAGVVFFRTGNIDAAGLSYEDVRWVTRSFHEANPKSALQNGDVVVSRVGYTGIAAVCRGLSAANCANMIIIRPSALLDPDYLRLVFGIESTVRQIEGFTAGSAQPVLNIRLVQRLRIPVPDLAQQRDVVLADVTTTNRLRSCEKELGKLLAVKRGLIDDLLTGRVRVNGDEDAA